MKKYEALKIITDNLKKNNLLVSTTGMISRELFSTGDRPRNFYMIGSMGLATPFALGIALTNLKKKVIVIEGDGSILLNLGIIPTVSVLKPKNLIVIVLDNEIYASTGGQPTISKKVNIEKFAKTTNFKNVKRVKTKKSFENYLKKFFQKTGPTFLLAKVEKPQLERIPRISLTPEEIKERFQKNLIKK